MIEGEILCNMEGYIQKTSDEEFLKDWEDVVNLQQSKDFTNDSCELISNESLEYFNGFRIIITKIT